MSTPNVKAAPHAAGPATEPDSKADLGPKILLMGGIGSGKSYSAASFLNHPEFRVFYLMTEPTQATFRAPEFKWKDEIGKRLHWHYCAASSMSFKEMTQTIKRIHKLDFKGISNLPATGKETGEIVKIFDALNNYKSDVTGEEFGSVDDWGPTDILVVDSLSGLNLAFRRVVIGNRPAMSQGEWGVAMNLQEDFLNTLCISLNCGVVLTAHLDRSFDEVTNKQVVVPAALGTKLGPKIGRFFDEVIECHSAGNEFYWSTDSAKAEVKRRVLPLNSQLPPDALPIAEAWAAASAT